MAVSSLFRAAVLALCWTGAVVGQALFDLTLTWEKGAPDGYVRDIILVNGQFPGPRLEIEIGQTVSVHVVNKMPFSTSVHFHGIEMHRTPWSDGVGGITQRPIRPGEAFFYNWTATQYGSYWYHAHERTQMEDGLYGPILIHNSANAAKPFNLISTDLNTRVALVGTERASMPLVLSDWRHMPSEDVWDITLRSQVDNPCFDSVLINGKGRARCRSWSEIYALTRPDQEEFLEEYNSKLTDKACFPPKLILEYGGGKGNLSAIPPGLFDHCQETNGPIEVIDVLASPSFGLDVTWVAFDIVGTFSFINAMVSIDEHSMWVYAVDGSYITPQLVEAITVSNGDRFSVFVRLDTVGDYVIRVASISTPQILSGYAILSYHDEGTPAYNANAPFYPTLSEPYINDSGENVVPSVHVFSQKVAQPFPKADVSLTADQTFVLRMQLLGASYRWALNTTLLTPVSFETAVPVLFDPDFWVQNNVTISTINNTWIDLVVVADQWPMQTHSIHKHGVKMFQVGNGTGDFTWRSVAEAAAEMPEAFNFVDPPMRDGFATPVTTTQKAWIALRYHSSNPGAWLLHCHVQSHMMGGMNMIIQDGVDVWPVVPPEYLCY